MKLIGKVWLDPEPWGAWLDVQYAKVEDKSDKPSQELGERLGVSSYRVNRWRRRAHSVDLDAVDMALCHWGDPRLLNELYPEDGDDGC